MNLHGDEMDNVELDPEKEEVWILVYERER